MSSSNNKRRRWGRYARFDETPEDPQASLVNLVDIMLVFICALIVALVSAQPQRFRLEASEARGAQPRVVEQGRELAEMPESLEGAADGRGMQPVGQVYRDPQSGKLILIGD